MRGIPKFKWMDVDYCEYLETTTERLQYHWAGPRSGDDGGAYKRWITSAGRVVGSKDKPWVAEIMPVDQWVFVGEFHTGREAKAAAIDAFIGAVNEAAMRDLDLRRTSAE